MHPSDLEKQEKLIADKVGCGRTPLVSTDMIYKAVLSVLEHWWSDKIALVWCVEDVRGIAKDQGVELSDEEIRQVLDDVLGYHDAMIGVTWLTISIAVDDLERARELAKCEVGQYV